MTWYTEEAGRPNRKDVPCSGRGMHDIAAGLPGGIREGKADPGTAKKGIFGFAIAVILLALLTYAALDLFSGRSPYPAAGSPALGAASVRTEGRPHKSGSPGQKSADASSAGAILLAARPAAGTDGSGQDPYAESAGAVLSVREDMLSDIGKSYGELREKYGAGKNVCGFEGVLFAEYGDGSYSFRATDPEASAYSVGTGENGFDVTPDDSAVCYEISTFAGALLAGLDDRCFVSDVEAAGFPAEIVSSRMSYFEGEAEGPYCRLVHGERVIDIALDGDGTGAGDTISKYSFTYITSVSSLTPGPEDKHAEIFGEWAKTDDYPYENLTKFCLFPDYTFTGTINLLDRMGSISGIYSIDGDTARCTVQFRDFAGYPGDDIEQFDLLYSDGTMSYAGGPMGDIYSPAGTVLVRLKAYAEEPSDTSPDGGTQSGPGPSESFEPYTIDLHYGCPIYDRPSSRQGTVTAYIERSTLYTIVEEAADEYGVVFGKLRSGVGWVRLSA